MTQASSVPKFAVRGTASGVFFMAFFSTLWAIVGIIGLQGWGSPWMLVLAAVVGLALIYGGVSLTRAAQHLPDTVDEAEQQGAKRTDKRFLLIFATEGVAIGIASVVCNITGRLDIFFPIVAIIVGAHFLPLASLFDVKAYYVVGALLCVLGLLAIFVLPADGTIGGQPVVMRLVVLGFGAALTLWSVGAGLWLLGKRLLQPS